MLIKTLTVLILAMPLFTPFGEPKKLKLHNNLKEMKEEVLKRIPIGIPIEQAREIMVKSGFKCEMLLNKSFAEMDYDEHQTTREGIDFLYCDKEKAAFPYGCDRRWQIAIVHKNAVVTEQLISIGLICP
jgi:hypothetical protein